jgi:hypothetical protein
VVPPRPAPSPPAPSVFLPVAASVFSSISPVLVPPIPPPITPVPPGGATVPAQSTAKREERARKEASQSAYVTRPAGTSSEDWFYPVVGVTTILALLLLAGTARLAAKPKLALAIARIDDNPRTRRGGP